MHISFWKIQSGVCFVGVGLQVELAETHIKETGDLTRLPVPAQQAGRWEQMNCTLNCKMINVIVKLYGYIFSWINYWWIRNKWIEMVYGVLSRQEQPRQDKNLLCQHVEPNEPTKEGLPPFVLFKSPFVWISTVNRARGDPSQVSQGASFLGVNYNLLETLRKLATTSNGK